MPTRVVHVNKAPFDVYIGRKTKQRPDLAPLGWGNPFHRWNSKNPLADYAQKVIAKRLKMGPHGPELYGMPLAQLHGKTLGCFCAPKGGLAPDLVHPVCHGQILAAMVDIMEELYGNQQQETRSTKDHKEENPRAAL